MSHPVFKLAKNLIEIPSTTGEEKPMVEFLSQWLSQRGWEVHLQEVAHQRENLFAHRPGKKNPKLLFNSHTDTVPPYFGFREDDQYIYGRGACDTKSLIAAQLLAAEELVKKGHEDVGLLYVVGEEVDHCGIKKSNELNLSPKFLIVAEPTESKLASHQKGALKLHLTKKGIAAHSGYPETGESAIDPMLDVLTEIKNTTWPVHPHLGSTTVNIGLIQGGLAANIVPPFCEAEVLFRVVSDSESLIKKVNEINKNRVKVEVVVKSNPMELSQHPSIDSTVVAFHTDIPYFDFSGQAFLWGAGSILDAHTSGEKIKKTDLKASVQTYFDLSLSLMARG